MSTATAALRQCQMCYKACTAAVEMLAVSPMSSSSFLDLVRLIPVV